MMVHKIEDLQKQILYNDNLYEKQYLSEKELEELEEEIKSLLFSERDAYLAKKGYLYSNQDKSFYKLNPISITNEEFNQYIKLKTFTMNIENNKNIRTIRNIVVFWLITSLILIIFYIMLLITNMN